VASNLYIATRQAFSSGFIVWRGACRADYIT